MPLGILFIVLAIGLGVVGWAAWQGGLAVVGIGALVLALWMAWMAAASIRGARRRARERRSTANPSG